MSGVDAVILLGPAVGHPEASHHLVEDQTHIVFRRELAQTLQVAGFGGNEAQNRFDDEARQGTRRFA